MTRRDDGYDWHWSSALVHADEHPVTDLWASFARLACASEGYETSDVRRL